MNAPDEHAMAEAAPYLLEALVYCVQAYEESPKDQPSMQLRPEPNHIFHARNAIAKATGGKAHITARVIFKDHHQAESFAKAWTRATWAGHIIGPVEDGGFYVDLYDVTDARKRWIKEQVEKIKNQDS